MFTPETSRHFAPFVDPVTGVKSWVLKTHAAAQQQGFYFVNASVDDACRYLWFYCAFPPAQYKTLGVVDFETDEVRHFPETEFLFESPLVDTDTGECIFSNTTGFYRRSPHPDKPLEKICDIPPQLKQGLLLCTGIHHTYSPDKSELFIDARCADRFIMGSLKLATGAFTVWKETDYCRKHGQFHPTNPDLALTAEDFWNDAATNQFRVIRTNEKGDFMRLWLTARDGTETLVPPLNGEFATHEWWSRDGKILYYCKYVPNHALKNVTNNGITGYRLSDGDHRVYAPVPAWHGFSSLHDEFYVYDENDYVYRGCPSRVGFYNAVTGKQLYIVSQNPALNPPGTPNIYHPDPHPRLEANDQWVSYTIVLDGATQVALCRVDQLLARTSD